MIKLTCFDKIRPSSNQCSSNEKICHFCQCEKNLSDEFYENKTIKVCILCRIIISNKKEDVYRCLLCHSNLSQIEIIKRTREYYEKNGTIPFPQKLDPDVKMADLPVYTFSKFPDKALFKNIVVFFSAYAQDFMEDEIETQFKVSKKKEPILKYYDFSKYQFSTEQLESIERNNKNIRQTLNLE